MYGLKYLQAQTIAKSSFSIVLDFSSCLLRVLEAYEMSKSVKKVQLLMQNLMRLLLM